MSVSSEGGLGENGIDGTNLDTTPIDDHIPEHPLNLKEQQYQVPHKKKFVSPP